VSCTTTHFSSAQAPCGRVVDGEVFIDEDEQALVTREMDYTCGCRNIRHEYHDGSIAEKIVHHNGTVLVDELRGAE
jgi:predicted metal-dependent HD superfamily phosphohydrolase